MTLCLQDDDLAGNAIFNGVDLNDSFVLSWQESVDSLVFNLEASLWPESDHYSAPSKGEWTCYKPATLTFKGVSEVQGLKLMRDTPRSTDANEEVDFGNIDGLEQLETGFRIEGDFGEVAISGGRIQFEVET